MVRENMTLPSTLRSRHWVWGGSHSIISEKGCHIRADGSDTDYPASHSTLPSCRTSLYTSLLGKQAYNTTQTQNWDPGRACGVPEFYFHISLILKLWHPSQYPNFPAATFLHSFAAKSSRGAASEKGALCS